jgi:hypothetical protein
MDLLEYHIPFFFRFCRTFLKSLPSAIFFLPYFSSFAGSYRKAFLYQLHLMQ